MNKPLPLVLIDTKGNDPLLHSQKKKEKEENKKKHNQLVNYIEVGSSEGEGGGGGNQPKYGNAFNQPISKSVK